MVLKSKSLLLLFIFITTQVIAQNKYTVSGYIKDITSGENLIAATIYVKSNLEWASTSNMYGFYSLSIPEGNYTLVVQYLGFKTKEITISLSKKERININLTPEAIVTEEVIVSAERKDENVSGTSLGTVELNVEDIKTLPALMGEVDILKTLQLLPGVQSAGEGNSGFYVRGGGPDQNLILLDEAVVYNTGHLFGFFSVFNADAIKNTTLIKGGMPANYGSRLSSVVDVSMKDGNNKEYHASGGIGLISSRLTLEGPLINEKSSFMLSGRRTYVDVLLKPFLKGTESEGNSYFFYDLNAKANYRFSDKDRLLVSGYFGRDIFNFKSDQDDFGIKIPWGNATTTLRWNHLFSDKLFMNLSLIYNDYNFSLEATQNSWLFILYSGIKDINEKLDFDFYPNTNHHIKFGLEHTYHTFIPNTASASSQEDSLVIEPEDNSKRFAHEWAMFVTDDFKVNDVLKINYGLRFSGFHQIGPYDFFQQNNNGSIDTINYKKGESVADYTGLEPRLSLRYLINEKSSFKAAVTYNNQYIHLVSNSTSTLPTDLWMPSTKLVQPQRGIQYSAGYFRNFKKDEIETSVEVYYKDMKNQIEYTDGYTPSIGQNIESYFTFGDGISYGAEFFINKKVGDLTGWIGYTWSKTYRQFDEINNGDIFPTKFDRRHDLSVVLGYDLGKRIKLGACFVYGSGNALTLPSSRYFIEQTVVNEYGPRNGFRLTDYHRLDISMTLFGKPEKKKKIESNWVFAVYNVYNRRNPYFLYFSNEGNIFEGDLEIKAKQVSLFPIIPSITWNFKF